MYRCAECDAPADLINEDLFRTCEHLDSAVVGSISVVLCGAGGVA